jgi:uncharacterized protein (TIGR02145 family)
MKFLSLLFTLFFISIASFSQAPKRIAYQAVIRNSSNALVVSSTVKVRFTILSGSINGTVVYSEVHTDTTNQNGLVTLQIGGGTVLSGNFAAIQWSTGSYYIKAETDPSGGNNFSIVTSAQLLTVPYAFYADSASNGMPKGTAQGQMLYWDGSKWALLPQGTNGQTLKWCNGSLTWDVCTPIIVTIGIDTANINPTFAYCYFQLTSDGGSYILEKGICYSTISTPTTANDISSGGSGNDNGPFRAQLDNLVPNTTYYARAFATNSAGTSYGSIVSFKTPVPPPDVPLLQTVTVNTITSTTAASGGNITSDGGSAITEKGILWNNTGNPTISINTGKTSNGTGSGNFISSLNSLLPNTKYYVRAYATNNSGTGYGNELNFTTATGIATLTTSINAIGSTNVTAGGDILNDGGGMITIRGVVWSTSPNPTIALVTKTTDGTGSGSFTSAVNGLSVGTTYYIRAYATNSAGTAYGNELSFTTLASGAVAIGSQVWMDKNLDVSTYSNGDPIPQVTDINVFKNLTTGAWIYYQNSADSGAKYGKLYNWYAVNDPRGLAPQGWHVPTITEVLTMANYLGGVDIAGGKMKTTGSSNQSWYNGNFAATNSSKFSALPGGELYFGEFGGPQFDGVGSIGIWWTSTSTDSLYAYWYLLQGNSASLILSGNSEQQKPSGLSVRCVKD